MSQLAAQLPDGFGGRAILALMELLVILPTAVIAWQQPADVGSQRSPRDWLWLGAIPLLALAWLMVVSAGPDQLLTRVGPDGGFSLANASCQHYAAQRRVAFGFGGAIRAGVEVCWNGRQAFVFGNPNLTPPTANLPVEGGMPYLNDLFSCEPSPIDTDFASVSEQCAEQIDADGTMRLTVAGLLSPAGRLAQRQLRIELVVDRNGKVIRFG
jgi:hypothetical protein